MRTNESDRLAPVHMSADIDFEHWCHERYRQLVAFLRCYLNDEGDASEDLAQEAFIRAYVRWREVGAMEHRDRWLYRVAINLANSRFRRRGAERRAFARVDHKGPAEPAEESIDDRLLDAVRALSKQERNVVVLRYVADLSVADTAEVLGCASGTVKAHAHRAISKLRQIVDEEPQ